MGSLPPKMYVTTDAVTFCHVPGAGLRVLLIRRRNPPYRGRWALPGGFVDEEEDLPGACARELLEETGVCPAAMSQLGAWGRPGRDPRGRNVTVAYLAVVPPDEREAAAGDDAAEALWHPARELPPMAFDHADIIADALAALGRLVLRTHLLFALLPQRFGLADVRRALEAVVGGEVTAGEARGLMRRARLDAPPDAEARGRLYRCTAGDFLAPLGG